VTRLALALPIQSWRSVIAVLSSVIYLPRTVGRAELNLLEDATSARMPRRTGGFDAVVFVATDIPIAPDDLAARAAFERLVRTRVERVYRRQGMRDVRYDLQLL
jgi:hypothetical protein